MHLIIVGAGPVGNSLLGLASQAGYDTVVIEPDEKRAEHCADRFDTVVLNADIADDDVIEEAGFDRARAIIATTTDDSTNLMAMVLGRSHGIKTLTSTVNHHAHKQMFESLGVHVLADPETLVARHLLDITLLPNAVDVTTLQDKEQIIEVPLSADSPLAHQTLGAIHERQLMDEGLFIVSVQREEHAFFPREDTELLPGDQIIVFSRRGISHRVLELFTGGE